MNSKKPDQSRQDGPQPSAGLDEILKPYLSRESIPGADALSCISLNGLRKAAAFLGCSPREAMLYCLERDIWPLRFKRNRGTLTTAGQSMLLRGHAAVIGCGGLGGHVIPLLARFGVGTLTVCDNDNFEESNLNRQAFCREDRLGLNKALAAQEDIRLTASHVTTHIHTETITRATVDAAIKDAHVVIDCLDNYETRHVIEQAAARRGVPFIHGAVAGHEGFVFFCGESGADRNGLARLYPSGMDSGAENPLGIPPATPIAAGLLQALLAVRVLTGHAPANGGRLWHLDLSVPEIQTLRF